MSGIWKCKVCGSLMPWSEEHQWYGSMLDIDGGSPRHKARPIVVTCSDTCRDRAVVLRLVPADAPLLR